MDKGGNMDIVTDGTLEFPWVRDMPKRERRQVQSVWDKIDELVQVQRDTPIVNQHIVACALRVSRQRVWQLLDEGKLEEVDFHGARFVTIRSLRAYAETTRKTGGRLPRCKPSLSQQMKAAWKAGAEIGAALAEDGK
jgi:hypothetical protein